MHLSREARYAIRALIDLAARPMGQRVDARRIGESAGLPIAFLHKILRQLTVAGVLDSVRGQGYALARPADAITLRDVLTAVEGDDVFDGRCIFWREECSETDPCELHFRWKTLRPSIEAAVAATTIAEVAAQGLPAALRPA